ncbi:MAG: hypothetical protein WBK86_07570 [Halanaerobiales bacterium]
MRKKVKIERTKKGFPALWEQGGGYSNTGEAQIVCDSQGRPKKPVYIRRAGSLANGQHALFVIEPGDVIIQANHHREDFQIEILQVEKIEESCYTEKYSFPNTTEEQLLSWAQESAWVRNRGGKVLPETVGEYKSYRYVLIRIPETFAVCSQLAQFDMVKWDGEQMLYYQPNVYRRAMNEGVAAKFAEAIAAAKEKATCYHCRGPHFVRMN